MEWTVGRTVWRAGAGARPRRSCAGARGGGDTAARSTGARSTGARSTAVLRLQEEDDDFAESPLDFSSLFTTRSFSLFFFRTSSLWDLFEALKLFQKILILFM